MHAQINGITSDTDKCGGEYHVHKYVYSHTGGKEKRGRDVVLRSEKRSRSYRAKGAMKVRVRRGGAFQAEGIAHAVDPWPGEVSHMYLVCRE